MTIKLLSTLLVILFAACNFVQKDTIQDNTRTKDTTKEIKQTVSKVANNAKQSNYSKLLGIWTDGNSENAVFDIRKDSIYYVD